MMATSALPFADTNVLLYLISRDAAKARRAEKLLSARIAISVQVLNEFASAPTSSARTSDDLTLRSPEASSWADSASLESGEVIF